LVVKDADKVVVGDIIRQQSQRDKFIDLSFCVYLIDYYLYL